MGVLHNLSKRISLKKHFDDGNAVETLLSFFRTKLPVYRMTSLLTLAYLVDEKNNHLIMASEGKWSGKIVYGDFRHRESLSVIALSCALQYRFT